MAPVVQESPLSQSTVAFHKLLENSGDSRMSEMEILNAAVSLYKAAVTDIVTQPAAFGLSVALISNNLRVSIRAGALILATLVDLRG
jgi:hypothetical protein